MTPEQLQDATGCSAMRASVWADPIAQAMEKYQINTPMRQAAFLAQIAHESGRFLYVREIWGPTSAQNGYEGRKDLGNTEPGDGFRFRGRGLIQITGRANYTSLGKQLGLDLVNRPELLELPLNAAMSAGLFWSTRKLNDLADKGDIIGITRKVNGGTNGLADRQQIYDQAKKALKA